MVVLKFYFVRHEYFEELFYLYPKSGWKNNALNERVFNQDEVLNFINSSKENQKIARPNTLQFTYKYKLSLFFEIKNAH